MDARPTTDRTQRIAQAISRYVPQGTALDLARMVEQYRFHLTITKPRNTKLGDYRAPFGNEGHRISVNGSLNPYAFLITFIHEVAHLLVHEKHRDKVAPHGAEWKQTFSAAMRPFLRPDVFPPDVLRELTRHMRDPAASTVQDHALMRVLRNHDPQEDEMVAVDTLPVGAVFDLNGRHFRKDERLRKRHRCTELSSGRHYLISGVAMVRTVHADR